MLFNIPAHFIGDKKIKGKLIIFLNHKVKDEQRKNV